METRPRHCMSSEADDVMCELAIMWHLHRLAHITSSGLFDHLLIGITQLEG